MTFLQGAPTIPGAIVHHTGSMIRFTTSQLPYLPTTDRDCKVTLVDGSIVVGRFHRHPQNPYIGGNDLVKWIKTWVQWNNPLAIEVEQVGRGNHLRLHTAEAKHDSTPERTKLRKQTLRLAGIQNRVRRRVEYEAWERDPTLRRLVLEAWGPGCQVVGCPFADTLPKALQPAIVDVHHVVLVSSGGSDSPLNLCVLCANHHVLIHRSPHVRVEKCSDEKVVIAVDSMQLEIVRDVHDLWRLIDV